MSASSNFKKLEQMKKELKHILHTNEGTYYSTLRTMYAEVEPGLTRTFEDMISYNLNEGIFRIKIEGRYERFYDQMECPFTAKNYKKFKEIIKTYKYYWKTFNIKDIEKKDQYILCKDKLIENLNKKKRMMKDFI